MKRAKYILLVLAITISGVVVFALLDPINLQAKDILNGIVEGEEVLDTSNEFVTIEEFLKNTPSNGWKFDLPDYTTELSRQALVQLEDGDKYLFFLIAADCSFNPSRWPALKSQGIAYINSRRNNYPSVLAEMNANGLRINLDELKPEDLIEYGDDRFFIAVLQSYDSKQIDEYKDLLDRVQDREDIRDRTKRLMRDMQIN